MRFYFAVFALSFIFLPTFSYAGENQQIQIHSFHEGEVIDAPYFGDVIYYVTINDKQMQIAPEIQNNLTVLNEKLKKINLKADFYSITLKTIMVPANSIYSSRPKNTSYLPPDEFDNYSETEFLNKIYRPYENKKEKIYNKNLNFTDFQNRSILENYLFNEALIIYPINETIETERNYLLGFNTSILYNGEIDNVLYKNILQLKPVLLLPEKLYSKVIKIPFIAAYPAPNLLDFEISNSYQ